MKVVKVLGSGCSKCTIVTKVIEEVIAENNFDARVEKVEDIMAIMEYNVMSTPGIVIDEEVVMTERTPSKEEVQALLTDNFANNACCSDLDSSCCEPNDTN